MNKFFSYFSNPQYNSLSTVHISYTRQILTQRFQVQGQGSDGHYMIEVKLG